ncbi:MAG: DUF1990 domain-containing protein [Galbitalea sp.]
MTRLALWQRPVSYAAVGATRATDLMRYPPSGYRPVERRVRIGHGDERWDYAWTQLFTWGMQRLSGMRVEQSDAPGEVTELTYVPVDFDAEGNPVSPRDGRLLGRGAVRTGRHAVPASGRHREPHRPPRTVSFRRTGPVVYVVDRPARKGFAYGTLPGHPESGEESWMLDRSEDGSVWLTIRAFSRPSSGGWWVAYPILRLVQAAFTRRYERALAGPIPA